MEHRDVIPTFKKSAVTKIQIAQFAGATEQFDPLSLDDKAAAEAGYHGVFVPSAMLVGFVEEMFLTWATNVRILSIKTLFQKMAWPSEALVFQGIAEDVYEKHGEYRVKWEIWAENSQQEIVLKSKLTGLLFKNAAAEKKAGCSLPVVSETTVESFKSID